MHYHFQVKQLILLYRIDLHQYKAWIANPNGNLKYNIAYALTSSKHGHHGAKTNSTRILPRRLGKEYKRRKYVFDSYYLSSFAAVNAAKETENSGVSFAIRLQAFSSFKQEFIKVTVRRFNIPSTPNNACQRGRNRRKGVYWRGMTVTQGKIRNDIEQ